MSGFEGSYLGDNRKISDTARMECKVCWYLYDPDIGDEVGQILPGTPFSRLAEDWRCPQCDGDKNQFLVVHD